MTVKAAIYARFSPRPNAADSESIEVQLDRCRAYCKAHQYDVAGEYADREMSGARADNRPGLQAAIEHAARLKGILVVTKLDRMARHARDAHEILDEQLHKRGADVAIIAMQVNTRSSHGRLFYGMLADFAQFEREQIAERTSEAMLFHQANGRRMSRILPYGWMLDPGDPARMVEYVEEQEIIERMRLLRKSPCGYRKIATLLNEAGLTCRGKPWLFKTVARILARVAVEPPPGPRGVASA